MTLNAAPADPTCSEIWAKADIYKPGSFVTESFVIDHDVKVFGGFDGTETSRNQRDPDTNRTILSDDINNNDKMNAGIQCLCVAGRRYGQQWLHGPAVPRSSSGLSRSRVTQQFCPSHGSFRLDFLV